MIVELLNGFAPQSLRAAFSNYGKDNPSAIAKYSGDYDAYVPRLINDYEVVAPCERPHEKSTMFRSCATRSPASGQLRCFKVMAPDKLVNFTGL